MAIVLSFVGFIEPSIVALGLSLFYKDELKQGYIIRK